MNLENLALGYVATAPSPATTGTSLTLGTGEGARFPATTTASFFVTLMPADAQPHSDNAEIVEVTDRTGDVLTIVRGQRGTTGKSVLVGWIVLNSVFKEDIEALEGASYVQNEVPTGDVDGVNDDFELSNTPVSNSLQLYLNGIRQKETDDYTLSGTTITFVSAPEVDDKITADYLVNVGTFIGSNSFIYNETPSGTIDGTNDDFTLANTPVTDTLQLFRDGQLLKGGGVDYTLTDDDIAFTTAPEVDSILLAHYQKSVASSGNADTLDGQHAPTGDIVGTTDTQTLTNKTLTSPVLNMGDSMPSTNVRCRAYASSSQTLTTGTVTKVQLNAESYDSGSDFDSTTNYRFTVPVNGYYLISAKVRFANSVDLNERFLINIYIDGEAALEVLRGSSYTIGAPGRNEDITFSDVIYLNASQYIELYARHDFGVDSGIIAGAGQTFLSIHLLST